MSTHEWYDQPPSPGLEKVQVNLTPPPARPVNPPREASRNSSKSRSRERDRKKRRQSPNQADVVLITYMDPTRPDLASTIGRSPLYSRSVTPKSDREVNGPQSDSSTPEFYPGRGRRPTNELVNTAQHAMATASLSPELQRNSVDDSHLGRRPFDSLGDPLRNRARARTSPTRGRRQEINGVSHAPYSSSHLRVETGTNSRFCAADSLVQLSERPVKKPKLDDTLANSPQLQPHILTGPPKPPNQLLPGFSESSPIAARPATASAPGPNLPPVKHLMSEVASKAASHPPNHGHQRGASVSSIGSIPSPVHVHEMHHRQSPQRSVPPMLNSPVNSLTSPTNHMMGTSPNSTHSMPDQYTHHRRSSTRSNGPYPYPTMRGSQPGTNGIVLPSTSTSPDGYASSHTNSTERNDTDTPRSVSLAPNSASQQMYKHYPSVSVNGGFKCKHEGCTAPPFHTQYLLNSHANVHSNDRPHYCPVKGCPRGFGGKGFKRKNEMIRHGLVHESPGYVCPFCPDREHKYPRPDNLQRHVRMHHEDKDKDDPKLREVLAQRPMGGVSRGRKRRA